MKQLLVLPLIVLALSACTRVESPLGYVNVIHVKDAGSERVVYASETKDGETFQRHDTLYKCDSDGHLYKKKATDKEAKFLHLSAYECEVRKSGNEF
jgi:hypothetical protein